MADPKAATTTPEARFTNVARIRHTATEFFVDFGQVALDQPGVASLVASLVMTPQHAKLLREALAANLVMYERDHGEIRLPAQPKKERVQ